MTGALGDVEVATYDANTAAAKLTKSLFDANGKLTEHAKRHSPQIRPLQIWRKRAGTAKCGCDGKL